MEKKSKKEDPSLPEVYDRELNELVDFVILSFETDIRDEDPIIEYMQRLKSHFQVKNPNAFRARFLKGYKVLLEEIIVLE